MITVQNDSNSSKYTALFQEAFDFLKENYGNFSSSYPDRYAQINEYITRKEQAVEGTAGAKARFTSVQEYFSHLKDIYDLGGRKFLMLPLDEPVFEIDANKREITVPAEFKKNGISVQGDEIAESLIFRINRFFDYSDLNEMVCQIQWENANKEQDISNAFVVDASRNAEYLYIMWPLTEKLTRYAGTIKFSVRFYKVSGSELVYSFSTKIAQATINPGHDFPVENWTGEIDDASRSFKNSISNSKNTAAEEAVAPYFLLDLDGISPYANPGEENADFNDGTVLEAYIDDEVNPTQILKVQATKSDTGIIGYEWEYVDTIAENGPKTYYLVPEIVFEEIAANTPEVQNKEYYYKDGTEYKRLMSFADRQPNMTLYERYSTVTVRNGQTGKATLADEAETLPHVVGKYKAVAHNSMGDNSTSTDSYTLYFPEPKILDFAEGGDLTPNFFLDAGTKTGDISVTPVIDEHGAKATYDWCYADNVAGPFYPIFGPASGLTQEERDMYFVQNEVLNPTTGLSANEDRSTLTINDRPGYYKVIVTSTRNYDTIKKQSSVCKVTGALQAPTITYPTEPITATTLYDSYEMKVQIAPMESTLVSEGITYQWYKYVDGVAAPIEGATTDTYVAPKMDRAAYYCEVTNHMGEYIASRPSPAFNVDAYEIHDDNIVIPDNSEPTPIPVTPSVTVNVSAIAPADVVNSDISVNQDKVTITRETGTNNFVINGNLDELDRWMSTNPGQQDAEHAWIAIDIATNLDTIEGATWDGSVLTADDVAESAANHLDQTHIVFWAKADALAAGRSITIGKTGYNNVTFNIRFENTQG